MKASFHPGAWLMVNQDLTPEACWLDPLTNPVQARQAQPSWRKDAGSLHGSGRCHWALDSSSRDCPSPAAPPFSASSQIRRSVPVDIFPWNRRLTRHVKAGEYEKALDVFHEMLNRGLKPNSYTFVPVINACSGLKAIEEGRSIHALVTETSCQADVYVGSCLVDMYAKCGSMAEAEKVFGDMPKRDVVSWTAIIKGYVKCGEGQKALQLCRQMEQSGVDPDAVTFVALLNACAIASALDEGRRFHAQIIQRGYQTDLFLCNSLINMYARCGRMEEAWRVFNDMSKHNVASWSAIIFGFVRCGQGQKAMDLARQMQGEGINPDPPFYVGLLNACARLGALEEGRRLHEEIKERGYENVGFVGNSLVDMYAKCGSVDDAWEVCRKMPKRDGVTWQIMILAYVKRGKHQQALEAYQQMQLERIEADSFILVAVLNACATLGALKEGKQIHEQVIQGGGLANTFVANSLIDMYVKCGDVQDAWRVFSKLQTRDVFAWTSMILGYVRCGQGHEALELSEQMLADGVKLDPLTLVAALNACASARALEKGRCFHEQATQRGFESNVIVATSLVDMYAKCGSIEDAWMVFNNMPIRNVVSWNAMLLGYVKCGEAQKVLTLYNKMLEEKDLDPDPVTFVQVLSACGALAALDEGRLVHERITQRGLQSDVFVGRSLVDMYAKCGCIEDARAVFDAMPDCSVVAWTTMILGYVKCCEWQKAFDLSLEMEREGVDPDPMAFVAKLHACAGMGPKALEEGRRCHEEIIQRGYYSNIILGNSLIKMYCNCGSILDAARVFHQMPSRDVVSLNTMILGYVKCGEGKEALDLFQKMHEEGVDSNRVTLLAALNACARVRELEQGRNIHQQVLERGYESDVFVGCSLVDMYSKCGSIEDARRVFDAMPTRNVATWNAMIHAYVKSDEGQTALELSQKMRNEGISPDNVTFVWLLNACAGLRALEEGKRLHEEVIQRGYDSDGSVRNSLAEMYRACGSREGLWSPEQISEVNFT